MHIKNDWYLQYLGKPWASVPCPPDSYNCGELVRAVYRDVFNIDSPAIPVTNAQSLKACVKASQPDYFGLVPLPTNAQPRQFDVMFMGRRNYMAHCGIAVETREGLRILHCPETNSGVCLDSPLELRWTGFSMQRWFRHKDFKD